MLMEAPPVGGMVALSIIIPHRNDTARLWRCLNALAPQLDPSVEVVVCDNGSDMPLTGVARDFPWARIVHEPTLGAGLARNTAVRASRGRILAFLDADCRPAADWIWRIQHMRLDHQIVAGRVDTFDETTGPLSGAQLFERVFAFDNARYVRELGFGVTANLLTTRAVFESVGPFRAGLPEDLDWCSRASAAQVPVTYDPSLSVQHPTRADWSALCKKYRRVEQERFAHAGRAVGGGWALRLCLTALSPLRDMFRVLRSPKLQGGEERIKCLAALFRLRFARVGWMWQLARPSKVASPGHPSKLSPGRH